MHKVLLQKQYEMLKLIKYVFDQSQKLLDQKKTMNAIIETRIFEEIIGLKYVIDEDLSQFKAYYDKVDAALASIE